MAAASKPQTSIDDPGFVRFLLNDSRAGALWLPLRLWLGWQWIQTADHKISDPDWMQNGQALKSLWLGIVSAPDTGGWYRNLIQMLLDAEAYTWLAKLIVYGELLIGIALVLGAFTGIAAAVGVFMRWNAMMAGTNPILFVGAITLLLGWKVAGHIGADYFLLSWLGTPWGRNKTETTVLLNQQGHMT